jgi:hypothetical protein
MARRRVLVVVVKATKSIYIFSACGSSFAPFDLETLNFSGYK